MQALAMASLPGKHPYTAQCFVSASKHCQKLVIVQFITSFKITQMVFNCLCYFFSWFQFITIL